MGKSVRRVHQAEPRSEPVRYRLRQEPKPEGEPSLVPLLAQRNDGNNEELLRELTFDRMITQGLADVDAGRVLSHEELVREISTWLGTEKASP